LEVFVEKRRKRFVRGIGRWTRKNFKNSPGVLKIDETDARFSGTGKTDTNKTQAVGVREEDG